MHEQTKNDPGQQTAPGAIAAFLDMVARDQVDGVKQALADTPALLQAADEDGMTALHVSARAGSPGAARVLIEHGADLEALDHVHRTTPLGWAAYFGHREVVAHLVAAGADTAYVNMYELTPREIALGGARGEHADDAPDKTPEDFFAIVAILEGGAGDESGRASG